MDARKGLTAYGVYVGNYVFAEETVTRLRSDKNGKVTLWFQELEEKSGLQLLRLLAAPLTHISSMESSLRVRLLLPTVLLSLDDRLTRKGCISKC